MDELGLQWRGDGNGGDGCRFEDVGGRLHRSNSLGSNNFDSLGLIPTKTKLATSGLALQ